MRTLIENLEIVEEATHKIVGKIIEESANRIDDLVCQNNNGEKMIDEIKHRAIVKVSGEFLRSLLFPEGTRILAIIEAPENFSAKNVDILIKVEHPDLPIKREGENYPIIAPSYILHYSGIEGEIPAITFDKW